MMTMKNRAVLLCMAMIVVAAMGAVTGPQRAEAQSFRNIASFSIETYFDSAFASRIENVFIAPLPPERLQLQVKVSNQTDTLFDNTRSLTMLHTGPIVLFTPELYGIAAYGAGFRDSGSLVHELDLQLHYETPDYRIGGGVRGHIEPDEDVAYVVPTVGGRVQLPRGFGVTAAYFVGINNSGDVNNSFWLEGDYAVTPVVTVKLGASAELGDNVGWPDGSDLTYNLLSGVRLTLSEQVSLRYQLDYIGRADESDGIRNFVYIDWRF